MAGVHSSMQDRPWLCVGGGVHMCQYVNTCPCMPCMSTWTCIPLYGVSQADSDLCKLELDGGRMAAIRLLKSCRLLYVKYLISMKFHSTFIISSFYLFNGGSYMYCIYVARETDRQRSRVRSMHLPCRAAGFTVKHYSNLRTPGVVASV